MSSIKLTISRSRSSLIKTLCLAGILLTLACYLRPSTAQQPQQARQAFIDGTGPGWRPLGEKDFARVNGDPDTWVWKDEMWHSTGKPIGVFRTTQKFTNFELVAEWRHLASGGNSGIFAWVPDEALKDLPPDKLPNYGMGVI